MKFVKCAFLALLLVLFVTRAAADDPLVKRARTALKKGVRYFRSISTQGGYLWTYTKDLSQRWGESKATDTQIWVQPPGTPGVGFAYLRAYEVTGDEFYFEAAKEAVKALVWGQLECGGWDYKIDFDRQKSQKWYYRHDKERDIKDAQERRNRATFDDYVSQTALRLIMAVDALTKGEFCHQAAEYGLNFMLKSQFPNGAWPQRFPLAEKGYSRYYTYNDGAINACVQVMLDAHKIYGKAEYLESAKRAGDFIIASQLPEPQAGWAQQYDWDMKPAWARKFEPPSVCSAVTNRNIKTLTNLYLETGEEKYLKPIPAALRWFEASEIAPNRWARFYELKTNRPLYFTRKYKLVYTDDDLPTHYGFQGKYRSSSLVPRFEKIKAMGRERYLAETRRKPSREEIKERIKGLVPRTHKILNSQDARGRWLSRDRIHSRTFITNVERLSTYLELVQGGPAVKLPITPTR